MDSLIARLSGVTFEDRQGLIARTKSTDAIYLSRNRSNTHDRFAIGCYRASDYKQLGWIPGDLAATLAPEMDKGTRVGARILEILGGANGLHYGVKISVTLHADATSNASQKTDSSSGAGVAGGILVGLIGAALAGPVGFLVGGALGFAALMKAVEPATGSTPPPQGSTPNRQGTSASQGATPVTKSSEPPARAPYQPSRATYLDEDDDRDYATDEYDYDEYEDQKDRWGDGDWKSYYGYEHDDEDVSLEDLWDSDDRD